MLRTTALTPMAHLTLVGHSRLALAEILVRYRRDGIDNVLCLGGDPPAGVDLPPTELRHAVELVELARSIGGVLVCRAPPPAGASSCLQKCEYRCVPFCKPLLGDVSITPLFLLLQRFSACCCNVA